MHKSLAVSVLDAPDLVKIQSLTLALSIADNGEGEAQVPQKVL
jgi:hypothetical protein